MKKRKVLPCNLCRIKRALQGCDRRSVQDGIFNASTAAERSCLYPSYVPGSRLPLSRRNQRLLAGAVGKLRKLDELLQEYVLTGERILIFTEDNRTAYRISLWYLVPTITHLTPEQKESTFSITSLPTEATESCAQVRSSTRGSTFQRRRWLIF